MNFNGGGRSLSAPAEKDPKLGRLFRLGKYRSTTNCASSVKVGFSGKVQRPERPQDRPCRFCPICSLGLRTWSSHCYSFLTVCPAWLGTPASHTSGIPSCWSVFVAPVVNRRTGPIWLMVRTPACVAHSVNGAAETSRTSLAGAPTNASSAAAATCGVRRIFPSVWE